MKQAMAFVIYVDDTVIVGLDSVAIEEPITNLGIAKNEQHHSFDLREESEVGDFLGICIEK